MSDVNETLQQLLDRRLREMGAHRGEPLSLLEAYNAIPGDHSDTVTYEVLRRVRQEGHTRIGDKAVRTIATMLDLDESVVRRAAGQRPKQGPFQLPARADKLNERERAVVLSVVDVILAAAEAAQDSAPVTEAASSLADHVIAQLPPDAQEVARAGQQLVKEGSKKRRV